MKTHTIYTREDCGCFADGTYGNAHVNTIAVNLALQAGFIPTESNGEAIESLDESDAGAWDDLAMGALEYMNEHCVEPGLSFVFDNGDLLLVVDEIQTRYYKNCGR